MEARLLEEIGLTKGEVAVYFSLLELGSSTVGPIVDKAKVSSSKVYDILERLIDKGLVSYIIRENKKYFEAASPKRILDYLEEKQEEIEQKSRQIENIMPQLLLKQKLSEKKQEVNIYEGVKGVKTAHEKTLQELKKGDEFYFMGASILSSEKFKAYWQDYHKRREKASIATKILFNQNVNQKILDNRNRFNYCEARYMPTDISTPSWIEVFRDITMIGVPSENPISVEIKNKEVAESFKAYFKALWGQKVQVFEGPKNVTKFYADILDDLKEGEEYYVLNGNWGLGDVPEIQDFFENFHPKRKAKGIKANFLFNSNLKGKTSTLALPPCEYRFLPPEFKSPLQMGFYKDKLYISLWAKKAIGFLIQRKDVVDAFKAYFDTMWNQDTYVSKGFEAFENAWNNLFDQIEPGDSYNVFGAAFGVKDIEDKFANYFRKLHIKRIKKGLKSRILFQQGAKKVVNKFKMDELYSKDLEFKMLPFKREFPVEIFPYKDTTLLLIQKKEPTIITIKNKEITESFINFFETLWDQSKKN